MKTKPSMYHPHVHRMVTNPYHYQYKIDIFATKTNDVTIVPP